MDDLVIAQRIERRFQDVQTRGHKHLYMNKDGDIYAAGFPKTKECTLVERIGNLQLAVQFYKRAKGVLEMCHLDASQFAQEQAFPLSASHYSRMRIALERAYGTDPDRAQVEAYAAMMLLHKKWNRYHLEPSSTRRMPHLPILPPLSLSPSGARLCAVCGEKIPSYWWDTQDCVLRAANV